MSPILEKHLKILPNKPLYHYTGQNGFLGIVDSQEIWATNLYFMNDSNELEHAITGGTEVINKLMTNSDNLSILFHLMKRKLNKMEEFPIFGCCFSQERDLLSQWRGYTGNFGFSLCFDPSKILEIAANNDFRVIKCIYDIEIQFQIAEEAVYKCIDKYKKLNVLSENDARKAADLVSHEFIIDFYEWGPLLKHPSFQEENEWRLISGPADYHNPKIRFRPGNYTIIPYCAINLKGLTNKKDNRINLGFYDVLVGPSPLKELPWQSVMQLLYSRNIYFTQITPSSIPYRKV